MKKNKKKKNKIETDKMSICRTREHRKCIYIVFSLRCESELSSGGTRLFSFIYTQNKSHSIQFNGCIDKFGYKFTGAVCRCALKFQ